MLQAGITRYLKVLEATWELEELSKCGGGVFFVFFLKKQGSDLLLLHTLVSKSVRVTGITAALRTAWC